MLLDMPPASLQERGWDEVFAAPSRDLEPPVTLSVHLNLEPPVPHAPEHSLHALRPRQPISSFDPPRFCTLAQSLFVESLSEPW